jgi:hypothetical protein
VNPELARRQFESTVIYAFLIRPGDDRADLLGSSSRDRVVPQDQRALPTGSIKEITVAALILFPAVLMSHARLRRVSHKIVCSKLSRKGDVGERARLPRISSGGSVMPPLLGRRDPSPRNPPGTGEVGTLPASSTTMSLDQQHQVRHLPVLSRHTRRKPL